MKAKYIFFLILLVSCTAKNDVLEVLKCLITNPKIVNEVVKIVKLVVAKDFDALLPELFQAYLSLKDDVVACFKEPVLLASDKICQACLRECGTDKNCMKACYYNDEC